VPDPLNMLLVFFALVAAAVVALWPRRGLYARVRRLRRETARIRLEDGLKHLLDCERSGRSCTLETLAGRLETTRGEASEVVTRLVDGELAVAGGTGFELTEAGREYALRILRTHRLWERYLADRTGVPPGEWHAEAERVEHQLSRAEAEALAARLGDPRFDPHGDPIPTSGGEIPAPLRSTLARSRPGGVVVRHVEDEPPEVFDRLVALGLAPGQALEVLEDEVGGASRVRVRVRGEVHELGPVEAGNVTVEPLPEGVTAPGRRPTLADAPRGVAVRVAGISPACQGPQRRRLLDLGVVPGTEITPELAGMSGDPVAYRIRGALIALRREQAEWIELEADLVERAG
jgi:DtxR family Mn-dependent transcriptional regulator